MEQPFHYHAFGWKFASDIPLAGWQSHSFGEADISINCCENLNPEDDFCQKKFQFQDDRILFRIPGGSIFDIEARSIHVNTGNSRDVSTLSLYLAGTCMGALAQLHNLPAFHGAAVSGPNGAIMLLGPSQAGKSSLATALSLNGWALLTEDLCLLDPADGHYRIQPGLARVKLCSDTAAALQIPAEKLSSIPGKRNKFSFGITPQSSASILSTICFLEYGDELKLERLSPTKSCLLLLQHLFRPALLAFQDADRFYLQHCTTLCRQITCYRLQRPRDWSRLQETIGLLESMTNQKNPSQTSGFIVPQTKELL